MRLTGRRIGLLTPSASRAGGGVFEAVVQQAAMIRASGGVPVVLALRDAHAEADRPRFGDAEVHHIAAIGPRQVGWAPALVPALRDAALDLLHLHGLWMYPSRAGMRWARETRRPYIISPHGMLDPWIVTRKGWKAPLARWGYERANWTAATLMHALTAAEAADIAAETGREARIVPNAAPAIGPLRVDGAGMVYLGRLHPKKNLEALIAAWGAAETGDAVLTIAGWGEPAHVAAIEAAIAAAGPRVRYAGPVHGADKARLLGAARWLVLPSLSEGLPMVVLEAWAAGTPTVMTEACHLPEGFAAGAALRCGDTPAAIAPVLEQALHMPDAAWRPRSAAAQALAAGPFGLATVQAAWTDLYAGAAR